MNETTQLPPQAMQVRITAPEQCRVHGWTVGGVYTTIIGERNTPDANGQEIYVESVLWKRPVWLSSSEYELIQE